MSGLTDFSGEGAGAGLRYSLRSARGLFWRSHQSSFEGLMSRLHVPCVEVLVVLCGFFAVVVADGLLDIAGVMLYSQPSDWESVLRIVNHPLAPH